MSAALTRELGAFLARLDFGMLPAAAVNVAKAGFTDCIGVMLAGSREPVTGLLEEVLAAGGSRERASLYFSGKHAPAMVAARINGTAAHALDYDDVSLKGSHPSAVLVPAILAEAEAVNAPGAAMLAAYVAGYEIWAELIRRESGNYQRKGWHPTGVFGAVAAAAACAVLRRLDANGAAHALGIAASHASGVMANLGSMVKPMHPGNAAAAGILSARLAAAGVDSAPDALENAQGFLKALSPEGDVDVDTPAERLGREWSIVSEGLSVKRYPVCYRAHRAIDAVLDLSSSRRIAPSAVKEVRVSCSRTHALILKNHRPRTGLAAKFSIEFALSCALVAGRVGLRELADQFVQRRDVQDLVERVAIDANDEEEPGTSGYAPYDWVVIALSGGERIESPRVRYARGDPRAPLTADDMWVKFEDCARWSGIELNAEALFGTLQALERAASVREIFASARPRKTTRRRA